MPDFLDIDLQAAGSSRELADMFDLAPVSLWLEDYSGLKTLFGRWRADGIDDLRDFLRRNPERLADCSAQLKVLKVNRRTLELYDAENAAQLVANLHQVFQGAMFDRFVEEMVDLWDGRLRFGGQTVNYTLRGRRLDILLNGSVLPGYEADWARVLVAIEDITDRTVAQRDLRDSERYARSLFEHSPVSLWVEDFSAVKRLIEEVRALGISDFRVFLDVHPEFVARCMQEIRVVDVNRQTLTLFGAASKDELLSRLDRVFQGEMHACFAEQLVDLWNGRLVQQREVVNYSLSGARIDALMQFAVLGGHEERWDQVLVSLTDITARRQAEAYLEFLGKHDSLTRLRNRAYFSDELNRLERRGPWPVSIVICDLNGLKTVNDSLGHGAGDKLLQRAGEVLATAVDRPGCAARIGGDEFALVLPATDSAGAQQTVERLQDLVAVNNQFHRTPLLSFSTGVATCLTGDRLEAAVIRADQRMYASKKAYYDQAGIDRRRHP